MNAMTEHVMRVFQEFRLPPTRIDEWNNGGRELLAKRLDEFTSAGKPVEFLMLGFPFKSSNHRDKTLGTLPDMAEEASAAQFRQFGEQLRAVYPAGMRLNIVSDGFAFNQLLEIGDAETEAYGEGVRDLMRGTPVEMFDMRDFYRNLPSLQRMRETVIEQFGIDATELERRILFDANINHLWLSISHFMYEELANRTFASNRAHKRAAKELARNVMFMNEAYSRLAAEQFASSIRLTMHASTNNGKWGIQMIPGPRAKHSPWHCALLVTRDGVRATVHRIEAEQSGAELVEVGGRPYYFVEKS